MLNCLGDFLVHTNKPPSLIWSMIQLVVQPQIMNCHKTHFSFSCSSLVAKENLDIWGSCTYAVGSRFGNSFLSLQLGTVGACLRGELALCPANVQREGREGASLFSLCGMGKRGNTSPSSPCSAEEGVGKGVGSHFLANTAQGKGRGLTV